MQIFKSFQGWFFGIIFLIGSIPYFWCEEYFLGLWSLVVVVFLIPSLYKFVSGRLNFKFSKSKTLVFSLVVFALLFANFIRPLFDKNIMKKEWTVNFMNRQEKINSYCPNSVKINEIKPGDSKKTKCNKLIYVYKACTLQFEESQKNLSEIEKSEKIPNSIRLGFLIGNHIVMPTLIMPTARNQKNEARKNIKAQCGDF